MKTFIMSIFIITSLHYMYDFLLTTFTIPKVKTISPIQHYKAESVHTPSEKRREGEHNQRMALGCVAFLLNSKASNHKSSS